MNPGPFLSNWQLYEAKSNWYKRENCGYKTCYLIMLQDDTLNMTISPFDKVHKVTNQQASPSESKIVLLVAEQ